MNEMQNDIWPLCCVVRSLRQRSPHFAEAHTSWTLAHIFAFMTAWQSEQIPANAFDRPLMEWLFCDLYAGIMSWIKFAVAQQFSSFAPDVCALEPGLKWANAIKVTERYEQIVAFQSIRWPFVRYIFCRLETFYFDDNGSVGALQIEIHGSRFRICRGVLFVLHKVEPLQMNAFLESCCWCHCAAWTWTRPFYPMCPSE